MKFNDICDVINKQIFMLKERGFEAEMVFVSSDVYKELKRNLLYSNYVNKDYMDFDEFMGLDVFELKDKNLKNFIHVSFYFTNKVEIEQIG